MTDGNPTRAALAALAEQYAACQQAAAGHASRSTDTRRHRATGNAQGWAAAVELVDRFTADVTAAGPPPTAALSALIAALRDLARPPAADAIAGSPEAHRRTGRTDALYVATQLAETALTEHAATARQYPALSVEPDLPEGMWPDLHDEVTYAATGALERLGGFQLTPDRRGVLAAVRLPDGNVVIGETTLRLFHTAARALAAAPANAPELPPTPGEPSPLDWSGYPKATGRETLLAGLGDLARFLGGDAASFTGDLLRMCEKAQNTPRNLAALAAGFPHAVLAWTLWRSFPMPPTAAELLDALAAGPWPPAHPEAPHGR